MSIADIVREARVLNAHGHKEGALRSLLVAVAATSKKRYPHKRYSDKVAFTAFVRDEMIAGNFFGPHCCIAVSMLWKGHETPLEDIL